MNCRRFEEVVNDIARTQIIEVGLRAEVLGHTRDCEECRRKLEDERRLTADLSGLAAAIGSTDAPEPLSARLLDEFDRQAAFRPQRIARISRRSWGAIAAALLLLIGLGGLVVRWRRSVPLVTPTKTLAVNPAPPQKEANFPPAVPTGKRESPPVAALLPRRRLTRRHDANESATSSETRSHHGREIATDFYVINYGVATLTEGGRVVRLLLPRSAMARFGLPVNMDRVNEPVQADVVLGIDGLPHAIRFVQEIAATANSKTPAPQADARKQRKEKKS